MRQIFLFIGAVAVMASTGCVYREGRPRHERWEQPRDFDDHRDFDRGYYGDRYHGGFYERGREHFYYR